MLKNTWSYSVEPTKYMNLQIVVDCTYWPVLASFNNWNIIHLTNKITSSEDFDDTHKIVLDGKSQHIASLVQLGKYGAINAEYPTTMGHYVTK